MPSTGRLRYLDVPARATGHVRARGTLVLIHGFPLSARMWEPQMVMADQGWRVVAPQLRGFDGGTNDPPTTSMDDYAADVIDLLDTLHVEDAVIGGLSMGGYVTFAMFRHAPRYFRALVLADTRAEADTPVAVQGREKLIALAREKGSTGVADELMPKLLGASSQLRADVVERVKGLIVPNSVMSITGALAALMTRQDSTPLLPTIHVPTLILVGEEDTLTPPALSDTMHRAIGGSALVNIPGAGHMSNLEQPAAFNSALGHFLEHRV